MAEFPALPLWTDAYLGDTTHLSTIEHGAYLLLLFAAWRSKGICLPDDDRRLARYAKLNAAQWARIKPTIMEFFELRDGSWHQGRLTDEYEAVKRFRHRQSEAGKASALKRKERHSTTVEPPFNQAATPYSYSLPLDKSNGQLPDPDKAFWDAAKGYLGKDKGSLINKLCGKHGREAVADALTTAMLTSPQPPDRTAWLIGILKKQGGQGSNWDGCGVGPDGEIGI